MRHDYDIYKYRNNFNDYVNVKSNLIIKANVDRPFFTIIIPTYMRAKTIRVAINSALNQNEINDYEIIIINNAQDAEAEKTKKIIEEFNSDKISYYVNEKNIGLCGNWNRCIEKANGKYIVMLHDDDILSCYCLRSLYEAIQMNNEPVMVGCSNVTFTSEKMPDFQKPKRLLYREVTKKSFFFGRYLGIVGMTFKRDTAIQIGGFSESYYPNEDTIFIYQMLLIGKVINIQNILVGYRTEFNLTITGNTMTNILVMTEIMRRNIAQNEPFAAKWMKKYDKESLYSYIEGANKSWSVNTDYKVIFKKVGLSEEKPSIWKMYLFKIASRLERFIHEKKELYSK